MPKSGWKNAFAVIYEIVCRGHEECRTDRKERTQIRRFTIIAIILKECVRSALWKGELEGKSAVEVLLHNNT